MDRTIYSHKESYGNNSRRMIHSITRINKQNGKNKVIYPASVGDGQKRRSGEEQGGNALRINTAEKRG